MHVTMVKKRLKDGSDCRKCAEATDHLRKRGMLDRIDEVVWAIEGDPQSPGIKLGERLGVDRAPFFVVRDGDQEAVYTSVLGLIRDHFQKPVSEAEEILSIDPDDIGGI
jgi:hypothetical protein